MKKKGFTLIELLAVIVILAIIALVAIPVVLNLVNNARKKAAESSTYGYIEAIEYNNGLADAGIEGYTKIENGDYNVSEINVKMKGTKPVDGDVSIENNKVTYLDIYISGYEVEYNGKTAKIKGKAPKINDTLNFEIGDITKTTKSATINFNITKGQATSKKCYYGESEYDKEGTINGNVCEISGLKDNKKYRVKIELSNSEGPVTKKTSVTTNSLGEISFSFNPNGGNWAKSRTVTIVSTKPEGTVIKYAMKSRNTGAPADNEFSEYTEPIEITENNKIIFAIITDGENATDYATYDEGKIDNVVIGTPTATVTSGGYPTLTLNGVVENNNNILKITYAAQEGTSAYYSTDNGATWKKYTGEATIPATTAKAKLVRDESKFEGSVVNSTLDSNGVKDAIGPAAYDDDDSTGYTVNVNNTYHHIAVDSSTWGKKLYVNTTNQNSTKRPFYFLDKDGNKVNFEYKGNSVNSANLVGKEVITIPNGAVTFGHYHGYITVYEIQIYINPEITNNSKLYPLLTSDGVTSNDADISITYDNTSVQKLYKIDDGEWKNYTKNVSLKLGQTIYAKGINSNGKATGITEYKAVAESDALPENAYNGTCVGIGYKDERFINVDASVRGKTLQIMTKIYGSARQYNAAGEVIATKTLNRGYSSATNIPFDILDDTVKIGFIGGSSSNSLTVCNLTVDN